MRSNQVELKSTAAVLLCNLLVFVGGVGGRRGGEGEWGVSGWGGLFKHKVIDCHSRGKLQLGLQSSYVLHASAGKMSSYAGGSSLGSG